MLARPEPYKHDPWNMDVEQAMLGAILRDNATFERASTLLSSEDFYDPLHARIFIQCGEMIARGESVTPLTLHATMKSDPGVIETWGQAYFDALRGAAPALPNIRDFALIIVDLARRRSLIDLGVRLAREATEAPSEIATEALIAGFEAELRAAAERGTDDWPLLCVAALEGEPVPQREFLAEGLLPKRAPTILGGDGGTGKSLLALQLAVSMQTGALFFGRVVEEGPALYVSAEDDADELHRRVSAIAADHGIPLSKLGNLHLLPLAGKDAMLALATPAGTIEATPLYRVLEQKVRQIKPALVVLDTLSDLFGGDENNRIHARQFIGLLRSLAMRHDTTILLLAHPSLSGLSSGTGSSGSTGWNNSVRSRLTLERVKSAGDNEDDPDLRVLKVKKANYAAVGTEIRVRWDRGVFRLASEASSSPTTAAAEGKADQAFLTSLDAYTIQGRPVSALPSATFAPTLFATDKSCGVGKRALIDAMNRLLANGKIKLEETGPPSKRRQRIVRGPV